MSNKNNAVALVADVSSGTGLVTAEVLQHAGYRVFGIRRRATVR